MLTLEDQLIVEECWKQLERATPIVTTVMAHCGAYYWQEDRVFHEWVNTAEREFWEWNATLCLLVLADLGELECLDN